MPPPIGNATTPSSHYRPPPYASEARYSSSIALNARLSFSQTLSRLRNVPNIQGAHGDRPPPYDPPPSYVDSLITEAEPPANIPRLPRALSRGNSIGAPLTVHRTGAYHHVHGGTAALPRTSLPKIVNLIWLGPKPIGNEYYRNMLGLARQNPDAIVNVYLDQRYNRSGAEALATDAGIDTDCRLRRCPNVRVIHARESDLITDFIKVDAETFSLYEACMAWGRYEMASQILRYFVLHNAGGVFFDIEDEVLNGIQFDNLAAMPHEFLVGQLFQPSLQGTCTEPMAFVPTSPLGAHPGNAEVRHILRTFGEWRTTYLAIMPRESGVAQRSLQAEDAMTSAVILSSAVSESPVHAPTDLLVGVIAEPQGAALPGWENHSPNLPFASSLHAACRFVPGRSSTGHSQLNPRALSRLAIPEPADLSPPSEDTGLRLAPDGRAYVRFEGRTYRVARYGDERDVAILTALGKDSGFVFDTVLRRPVKAGHASMKHSLHRFGARVVSGVRNIHPRPERR